MELFDGSRPVLVAGAGLSGKGAAKLLAGAGYRVILYDGNPKADLGAFAAEFGEGRITPVTGPFPEELTEAVSACVISPGIPLRLPFVKQLRAAGVPVVSEIAAAASFAKGRMAAVTGTNGKTTTTALTGHLLRQEFPDVHVVGNIGRAFSEEALETTEDSLTVAELSSFQLETAEGFRPDVSAILNITPDHLDRHGTLEEYARVKKKICALQREDDICILNREDRTLADVPSLTKARILYFSSRRETDEGAFLRDGRIILRLDGREREILPADALRIPGRHNQENAMAALLAAVSLGLSPEAAAEGLRTFAGVEHRIEFVLQKDGVVYYNDSKGTNPDASVQAVRAMGRPILLIAGGYDKKADFSEWLRECRGRVRHLILLGATAEQIERQAREEGVSPVSRVASLEEAVALAKAEAGPGDAVLLSPACASWDMFPCFEARGDLFKKLVRGE